MLPLGSFVSEYEVLGIIDLFTCDRYVYFGALLPTGGYKVLSVVRGSWPKQNELALRRVTSAIACEFIADLQVRFSLLGLPRSHRY